MRFHSVLNYKYLEVILIFSNEWNISLNIHTFSHQLILHKWSITSCNYSHNHWNRFSTWYLQCMLLLIHAFKLRSQFNLMGRLFKVEKMQKKNHHIRHYISYETHILIPLLLWAESAKVYFINWYFFSKQKSFVLDC